MLQIGKVLYILNDNLYIHCENDTFVIKAKDTEKQRIPANLIQQIVIFGNTTVSSYLIRDCSEKGILVSYIAADGRYYGGLRGKSVGNILLRHKQYQIHDDPLSRSGIAKNMVLGKAINQKQMLRKHIVNCEKTEKEKIQKALSSISEQLAKLKDAIDIESIRGIEGSIASTYFGVFDCMIKASEEMRFIVRSRRPPENNCNALLSFFYAILTTHCISALETFGLDAYMSFLHELHPGRESLASDLVEEFRAPLVDHFTVTLINRSQVTEKDFEDLNGEIRLNKESRKRIITLWEEEREKMVYYPLQGRSIPQKLLPYMQAQLLAQCVRGDIDEYPTWIWEGG